MCGGLRPVRQQRLYLRQMCVLALGIGVGQMQTLSFAQGQVERGTCVATRYM